MSTLPTAQSRGDDILRTTPVPPIPQKHRIGYDTIGQIDGDEDLGFALRGFGYNPLIDAATPLLGLVIRIRQLKSYSDVEQLYGRVRNQITALDEEIRKQGYDGATQLSFRYALCAFVDEAVASTSWGSHSSWTERSLLSVFHNETWGGEKFFTVLARMLMDPEKYRDVLEFKYLCLCLGFKGKYGAQHNGTDALNTLIDKLHRVLRELRGEAPEHLTDAKANIASRKYRVSQQWPWWSPWLIALGVLVLVYLTYAFSLGQISGEVLHSLDGILKL